jgi:DNA-binding MarR family transcriptional regulator
LEIIYSKQGDEASLTQRDLAGEAGLSLGMTNALLKRFAERGWVKLKHISRRSLRYILTPEGMEEVLQRSISYFTRAARSAALYRNKINEFVRDLPGRGFSTLVLEGPAELDFLFEYACDRYGLAFVKNPHTKRRELYSSSKSALFVFTRLRRNAKSLIDEDECIDESSHKLSQASAVSITEILFDCPPMDKVEEA